MANFDFVLQYPLTITAESESEAKLRADEWFIGIQEALLAAHERLIEKGGVLIVGPATVVPKEPERDKPA
jgi:hypothetical protein